MLSEEEEVRYGQSKVRANEVLRRRRSISDSTPSCRCASVNVVNDVPGARGKLVTATPRVFNPDEKNNSSKIKILVLQSTLQTPARVLELIVLVHI